MKFFNSKRNLISVMLATVLMLSTFGIANAAEPDVTAPSIVTGVAVVDRTDTTVTLSWSPSTDDVGVVRYKVWDEYLDYVPGVADGQTTTATITGLKPNTLYNLHVTAYDAAGNWSEENAPEYVFTTDHVAPTVPSNLNVTATTKTTISLTWNKSSDASESNMNFIDYVIFDGTEFVASPIDNDAYSPTMSYTVSGLVADSTHTYTVIAVDGAGNESAPSNAVTATARNAYIDGAADYGMSPNLADNTAALQSAVNASLSQDLPLYIPTGTYNISKEISVALHSLDKFTLYGDGVGKTVLKRTDGSITADNQQMFNFKVPYFANETSSVKGIELYDFTIDGNKRGNPFPAGNTNSNLWEHSANITILGDVEKHIESVLIHDISAFDPVADHVRFAGSGTSYVDGAYISNFNAYDRNGTRSDIYASGGMEQMTITKSNLTSITVNFTTPYEGPYNQGFTPRSRWIISDTTISSKLEMFGKDNGLDADGYRARTLQLEASRVNVQKLGLREVVSFISDSTIYLADPTANRIDSVDAHFDNVTFKMVLNASGNITPLTFYANDQNSVYLQNSNFVLDDSNPTLNPDGFAIWLKPKATDTDTMSYFISGNTFDSRLKKNIDIDRAHEVTLRNNAFSGSDYAVRLYSSATKTLTVDASAGNTWPATHFKITGSSGLTLTE